MLVSLPIIFALFLLTFLLALNVTRTRFKYDVPFGEEGPDGLIPEIQKARRAHYTVMEYSVYFVPMLIVYDLSGGDPAWILSIGIAFVITRISHAIAHVRFDKITLFRIFGAVGGYIVIFVFGVKIALTLIGSANN